MTIPPASHLTIVYFFMYPTLRHRELVIPISPFCVFLNEYPLKKAFNTAILRTFNMFQSTLRILNSFKWSFSNKKGLDGSIRHFWPILTRWLTWKIILFVLILIVVFVFLDHENPVKEWAITGVVSWCRAMVTKVGLLSCFARQYP